jgi:hypothetical protein
MADARARHPWTIVLVLLLASSARGVVVTDCGQHVAPGDTGVLENDVVCTSSSEAIAAVYLGDRATLSLNGHAIIARPDLAGVASDAARRFAVIGPGVITGAALGVAGGAAARATLQNLTLADNRSSIDVPLGRLDMTDVTSHSTDEGIRARDVRAERVSVDVDFAGDCILGRSFRGTDVVVTGCYTGIGMLSRVRAVRLDDRNNLTIGVSTNRARLVDSVVTGNDFIGQPLDLLTQRRPVLVRTTCDASAQRLDSTVGPTWGVCAGD